MFCLLGSLYFLNNLKNLLLIPESLNHLKNLHLAENFTLDLSERSPFLLPKKKLIISNYINNVRQNFKKFQHQYMKELNFVDNISIFNTFCGLRKSYMQREWDGEYRKGKKVLKQWENKLFSFKNMTW